MDISPRRIRAVSLLVLVLAASPFLGGQTITLADEGTFLTGVVKQVLSEAYTKLGYNLELRAFSMARSLEAANDGTVDGVLMRVAGLEKNYKNLIMVSFPVLEVKAVAFSLKPIQGITGYKSLSQYRIGIPQGIIFAEQGTQGMQRDIAPDFSTLFRKLSDNRIDVAIADEPTGRYWIRILNLNKVIENEAPLQVFGLYHYLTVKYAALASKISAVIGEMQKSGRIKQIIDGFVQGTFK